MSGGSYNILFPSKVEASTSQRLKDIQGIDINIDKENLENIYIDREILENTDINMEILRNVDKISNRLEFGISNRSAQQLHKT